MEHQVFFEAVAQIIPALLIAILLGSRFSAERKGWESFLDYMLNSFPPFVIFTIVLMGEAVALSVLWKGVYRKEQLQLVIVALIFSGLIIANQIFSFLDKDGKSILGYVGILVVAGIVIWQVI